MMILPINVLNPINIYSPIQSALIDEETIYFQNFDSDSIYTYPSGWTVVSADIEKNFSATVRQGPIHSYDVYGSRFLLIEDTQIGETVDLYRTFSNSIEDGRLEFDYWMYGSASWRTFHQIILENATGFDVITIKFMAQFESHWSLHLGDNYCPSSFDYMASKECHFIVEFINSNINVFGDGWRYCQNLPYSDSAITQIRIRTTSTLSTEGESWIDNFLLVKYANIGNYTGISPTTRTSSLPTSTSHQPTNYRILAYIIVGGAVIVMVIGAVYISNKKKQNRSGGSSSLVLPPTAYQSEIFIYSEQHTGERVSSIEKKFKFCSNCGYPISNPKLNRCENCGKSFKF